MPESLETLAQSYQSGTLNSPTGSLNYRLLHPADSATPAALVIFLHGAGERGSDNLQHLTHGAPAFLNPAIRTKHPAYVVAPQCPYGQWWSGRNLELVMELIDTLCAEHPIDQNRVLITGISMGGYGTWDLITQHPQRFAAAVPICGGGNPDLAGRIQHLPVHVVHGTKDDVVFVDRSRLMVEALQKLNAPVQYTEYPDALHDSWTDTYNNESVLNWLFNQSR